MSAFSPSFPRPMGGPLIAWEGAFSAAEVDRITAMGDALVRARAELVAAEDRLGSKRITDVSWFERNADTQWLYARLEGIAQQLNRQYYKYNIYNELREALQFTIYESRQGGHYDWHVDHGAGGPQAVDVPVERAHRHPGLFGKASGRHRRGQCAKRLEQAEQTITTGHGSGR